MDILLKLSENFPAELRAAFGLDKMDLTEVLGYFSFVFLFVQLCLAIQAANYGFGLVSIEENELTADFLLSKPVSRSQVLTSKLLAALTSLTITNLVVWVTSFAAISLFRGEREYEPRTLLLLLLSILIFQLFFLSVGLVISLLVKRVRSVTPFTMALVFGLYILNAFGGMIGEKSLPERMFLRQVAPPYTGEERSPCWGCWTMQRMSTGFQSGRAIAS